MKILTKLRLGTRLANQMSRASCQLGCTVTVSGFTRGKESGGPARAQLTTFRGQSGF
jgi:hypothetical protein